MQRNYMMIAVLLVIAGVNAWEALVERELPTFHLTVTAVALVLAVIVAISRYEFPVRAERVTEQTRGRRRLGILLVISGSLASVLWVAFGPWRPRADFDVSGFLFLIQNVRQVVVLGVFVAVACTGRVLASRLWG